MRARVCLTEMANAHVGVYLGRADRCVAEHVLDAAQIGAALEQMGRERVPEGVRRALRDAGPIECAQQAAAHVGRVQRPAADAAQRRRFRRHAGCDLPFSGFDPSCV